MKSTRLTDASFVDDDRLFLGSCLELCLPNVEELSVRSADLLRLAIGQLRHPLLRAAPATVESAPPSPAIILYLRYLLPELDRASPGAAKAVRQALLFLDPSRLIASTRPVHSLH